MKRYWTIVQHSKYQDGVNPAYAKSLEVREIPAGGVDRVKQADGVVFEDYAEAVRRAEVWEAPNSGESFLYGDAAGTFADERVDGLRVYVPVRVIVG